MVSNNTHAGAPTNVINAEQTSITYFGPSSSSQTSQEFTVDQFPFYFSAFNLGADDVITVEQVVSHGGTKLVSTYQPVYGPLAMDINRSKLVIEHPGRYQLVHSGSSSLGTFTVIGAAASSASTGFAELAAGLQAAIKGASVVGTTPVVVTGSGTQADPFNVTTPDIVVEHISDKSIAIGQGAAVGVSTGLNTTINIGPGSGDTGATLDINIGRNAGANAHTGGTGNICIGNHATFGGFVTPTNFNILMGYYAVSSVAGPTTDGNVLIGYDVARSLPNVANAVIIGGLACNTGNSGNNVTAVGYRAGNNGRKGTYYGSYAGDGQTTVNNVIVINNPSGVALVASQDNQVVIGDASITQMVTAGSIIQGGVISASDERLKTKIEAEWEALNNINQLNPVTFNWNKETVKKFDAVVDRTQLDAIQHGLIAQEVEQIFPEFVSEIDRGGGAYKVVRYEKLIPVMIAAIQELSQEVTELKAKLNVK